jgi:hypothetical protein
VIDAVLDRLTRPRRRRPRARHLELWTRHDVAGHAAGCEGVPLHLDDEDGSVAVHCDCFASTWRRWRPPWRR